MGTSRGGASSLATRPVLSNSRILSAVEGPTPLIAVSCSLSSPEISPRVALQTVNGVLVGPNPERLRAALIEGGELRQFGKHPEMVETTGHRRGAYRRSPSMRVATVALVARIRSPGEISSWVPRTPPETATVSWSSADVSRYWSKRRF